MTVRTRFAPSPTGFLHVGGARTALFAWLYARKHGGEFVLRMEDTDRERSSQAASEAIIEELAWLGLKHDLGPFYQSERRDRYRVAVERLLGEGKAYRCYCTREELDALRDEQQKRGLKPRYDGRCRERKAPRAGVDPVVRFKAPAEGVVAFDDLVHGRIEIANSQLDDLVLLRSDGTPTYNLTVVVDDAEMKITHVIRGDDHVNNTPRQIHVLEALGEPVPHYAHLPMILDEDGSRLSKRSGACAVGHYRDEGYLPQAMLNYLVRLGWSSGDREIFSLDEMIAGFSLDAVNTSAAALNSAKLKWLNQHYLQALPAGELLPLFEDQLSRAGFSGYAESSARTFDALRTRYKTLKEMAAGAAFIYGDDGEGFDEQEAAKRLKPAAKPLLEAVVRRLEALDAWGEEPVNGAIEATLAEAGVKIGSLGPALRFAVTGGAASPALAVTVALVGRDACVRRVKKALEWMSRR